jgi:hypothetical protein
VLTGWRRRTKSEDTHKKCEWRASGSVGAREMMSPCRAHIRVREGQ